MTLLITVIAACTATVIWYSSPRARTMKIGTLALTYWGASLMWLVDAVAEYIHEGAESYFSPAPADMLNDAFLGLSACTLGVVIWLAAVIIKDPANVIRGGSSEK